MALIPGFTFKEETDMISALYSAVAMFKKLEEESYDNKIYWNGRVKETEQIADKFYNACQNALYNL